ncbi:hypothetical protein CIPAW_05G221500 [Carya illinoinensis]|uniref:Uncharacterized protein n=1 Tax=Carya illinoinensis TaxID=32201 RepID=A0A8T1QL65_CARIL|nr:hypothetical protein CIPAW_05G221500 [Carya illinoinensis]
MAPKIYSKFSKCGGNKLFEKFSSDLVSGGVKFSEKILRIWCKDLRKNYQITSNTDAITVSAQGEVSERLELSANGISGPDSEFLTKLQDHLWPGPATTPPRGYAGPYGTKIYGSMKYTSDKSTQFSRAPLFVQKPTV